MQSQQQHVSAPATRIYIVTIPGVHAWMWCSTLFYMTKTVSSTMIPYTLCWVQEVVPEMVGASLVMATRCGLDQPQPVLDSEALASLVNVPTGKFCHPAGHKLALQKCIFLFLVSCFFVSTRCVCRVTSAHYRVIRHGLLWSNAAAHALCCIVFALKWDIASSDPRQTCRHASLSHELCVV